MTAKKSVNAGAAAETKKVPVVQKPAEVGEPEKKKLPAENKDKEKKLPQEKVESKKKLPTKSDKAQKKLPQEKVESKKKLPTKSDKTEKKLPTATKAESKATKKSAAKQENEHVEAENFFEFDGAQIRELDIRTRIEEAYKDGGHRISSIKKLQVYYNFAERRAYYVINGKAEGLFIEF